MDKKKKLHLFERILLITNSISVIVLFALNILHICVSEGDNNTPWFVIIVYGMLGLLFPIASWGVQYIMEGVGAKYIIFPFLLCLAPLCFCFIPGYSNSIMPHFWCFVTVFIILSIFWMVLGLIKYFDKNKEMDI
jgi:hypothetical protein